MKMRINSRILSIPPFISTSWKNIISLHCEFRDASLILVVSLSSGASIEVPQLEAPVIETIFSTHAKLVEQDLPTASQNGSLNLRSSQNLGNQAQPVEPGGALGFPLLQIGPGGIENFGSVLQHNPEQAEAPDLPKEILNKITSIAKSVGMDDPNILPKPEPHCNCFHCQISRAVHTAEEPESLPENTEEEVVTEADLKFRLWDISQTADQLFLVTNPMDSQEHYSVFLGDPIGCTCGEKNCEHIRAVLNS